MIICGADIESKNLILVGVTKDDAGNLTYMDAPSVKFTLHALDQSALKAFHKSVAAFVTNHGITSITLRRRPSSPKFPVGPAGAKIEAAVQLLDDVAVTIVPAATLTAWLKKSPNLPSPKFAYQQHALESACYAAIKG